MKKQIASLLAGMMVASALLGGCGSEGQQAPEQAVSGAEPQQESSQQAETPESSVMGENKVGLDEPYVLVRESVQKNGMVIDYDYDERGDKTKETYSYKEKPDETHYKEYTTQYQEDGSKIVSESQDILEATGEAVFEETYEYEYDPDGLLIRKTGFKENGEYQGEIIYEYDENGNLISQSEGKTGPGITSLAMKYEYDNAGNLIKETQYDFDGEVNQYWTYEYDQDGKQTVKHNYDPAGEEMIKAVECQWKYEYDEEGRVVEEWQESVDGGHKYEWYQYEYDEYGNVCKKTDVFNKTTYEYLPLSVYLKGN